MYKRIFVVCLLLCALLMPMVATAQPMNWATELDLIVTPDGQLGVEVQQYMSLPETARAAVSELLSYLLANPGSFNVKNGKLQFTDMSTMPEHLWGLASIWRGQRVEEKVKGKLAVKTKVTTQSTPPYPGAYWWYQYVQLGAPTYTNSAVVQPCHPLSIPFHNSVSNVLMCSKECKKTASGTISVSGGIPSDLWSALITVDYSYSVSRNCSISLTSTVPPGWTHTIVWCYSVRLQTISYAKFYWEDQNEDGVGDWCLYIGNCDVSARQVSGGSFDITTAPNPCQRPCATPHCPYR